MASFSSKKVSQQTFDDIVKENMVEFDMEQKEAIEDAVKQMTSQNVNLSDIDLSGGVGREEVVDCVSTIVNLSHSFATTTKNEKLSSKMTMIMIENLTKLISLCNESTNEMSKRNTVIVHTNGGLNALLGLLIPQIDKNILIKVMTLLEIISSNNG